MVAAAGKEGMAAESGVIASAHSVTKGATKRKKCDSFFSTFAFISLLYIK
jgi:hypothetical protein